jgi:scyllo-inositol 2-dehydrogenase (NADP+)
MSPLRIGIIGFGRIGAEHAAWISATPNARVQVVFDPTPARRAAASSLGHSTVDSIDALLRRDDVDAVLVSNPTSMHFDAALAALQAGKRVMVEKPMTLDAATAKELIDEADRRSLALSVFHCRRWDIDFLTVCDAVRSGALGRVFNVESRLGQWASCVGPATKDFRPGWRNEASFGGGGLYDWGSHFIDQLWGLFRPARPVRVVAQLRGNVWTSDCDDFARVLIDFDNGAVAMCEINTTTTRPLPRWHIDGTLGSASSPHSLAFDTHEWARLTMTAPDGSMRMLPKALQGLSESQIWEAFAWHVNGEGDLAVSPQSALRTMMLLDAARTSAREGRAVEIDFPAWASAHQ